MQITIHPDFKVNGQSFSNIDTFLGYIKKELTSSYDFLNSFLDVSESISVHTSGSTGSPKQIILSKKFMLNSAKATQIFFDLPKKTKALHCLSTDYIAGKMMWVRAIQAGWHLDVVAPSLNPLQTKDIYYDFSAMVPMQAQGSLSNLHQIKKLLIGGAPIHYLLEKKLVEIPIEIFQTYGMTETITHIAVKRLGKKKQFYHSLPNVQLSIDERSCLIIKAPLITKEDVITNDVVNLISKSKFIWLGRFDNVINSGGVKLFPEEIERKLALFIPCPFIVASIKDKKYGEILVLIIESTKKNKKLSASFFKATLSKYEIPKEVFYLESFPRTNNGKIIRSDVVSVFDK